MNTWLLKTASRVWLIEIVGFTLLFEWGGIRERHLPDRLERYAEVIG